MKKSIKSIAVLVSICAVVAILMSLTNDITAPIIKENENKTANAALSEVMPNGGTFELYDISSLTLPATVTEVYSASNGGYVIKMNTSGYASGMVIMCGVSAEGVVTGAKLVSSQETPSIGGTAAEAFSSAVAGKDLTSIDSVDTVSGATKTTAAYRAAVKDALNAFIVLGGGSVDLRTEEEILLDNLGAALPAGNREFDKHFFVEEVAGIDAMYTAKNNTGYVYVIGEAFIGVNASGEIVSECTADESAAVLNAVAVISASETSDVDLTQYTGISANVTSIKKTASGNYVIEISARGYSAQNPYAPADQKKPIVIKVSVTAEGKIIDCLTVSQSESKNFGDACADEKFYGQFDGKTETDYGTIDAISGATVTTNAYKNAILTVFDTVKILQEVTE